MVVHNRYWIEIVYAYSLMINHKDNGSRTIDYFLMYVGNFHH